jgi:(2S)-methylsuccinyl-CoA dehydrogenase
VLSDTKTAGGSDNNSREILDQAMDAARKARDFANTVRARVTDLTTSSGRLDPGLVQKRQRLVHGYAWIETIVTALECTAGWATRLVEAGQFSRSEGLILQILFGEYSAQLLSGIALSQSEIIRPREFGMEIEGAALALADDPTMRWLLLQGNTAPARADLVAHIMMSSDIPSSLGDDTLDTIRSQYRRFADTRILPAVQEWHLANALIPEDIINDLAELGTFGMTIDSGYGGLGLGRLVMCIVTEELSRGWLGIGSLGTRSEIAGELIQRNGTPAQKEHWLPAIASGRILPTAVFTEPDYGSDLGGLRTRGERRADGSWSIFGSKTWITHAARSDLMTLLARTTPRTTDYQGLSLFLLSKRRGNDEDCFPDKGIAGGEIEVLGYRGMREYELSFDGFWGAPDALLGGVEGQGFKQLMSTFEGARVQTAARAIGVARRAFELGLSYAQNRKQFGQRLVAFPRVYDKLALMLAEIIGARELTYYAARAKDNRYRCDVEAGMAKLLAARVAWSNADSSLQIHGGNGYALESEISRILCDARVLSVFEGSAEIQAQVVGRGCLTRDVNHRS